MKAPQPKYDEEGNITQYAPRFIPLKIQNFTRDANNKEWAT